MGKALYRRYRSTSFDEVIGQDHITTTLKNTLANNAIAHAYLFTGPRGVGKTSIARILAFEANGLSYAHDASHLDIIEIDAASNRRIDEVRSLRERVNIAPTSARYKVYIIDEVHMLTREAFNALLKTLEEPPAHVIFILATTEVHKLPETIVSRCIRFTFKPIERKDIVEHLKNIAKKEKIDIDNDSLELLAGHANGSFRDSISLLEQFHHLGSAINKETVEQMLGIASDEIIGRIKGAIYLGNPKDLELALEQAYDFGAGSDTLAKQLSGSLRSDLINRNTSIDSEQAIELLKNLMQVPGAMQPSAELELALLDVSLQNQIKNLSPPKPDKKAIEPKRVESQSRAEAKEVKASEDTQHEKDVSYKSEPLAAELPDNEALWSLALHDLKKQNNALYSIARMAQPRLEEDTLELAFKFAFHYKQMNESKNKAIVSNILKEHSDKPLKLQIILNTTKKPSAQGNKPKSKNTDLSTINNIFGSHEMLES